MHHGLEKWVGLTSEFRWVGSMGREWVRHFCFKWVGWGRGCEMVDLRKKSCTYVTLYRVSTRKFVSQFRASFICIGVQVQNSAAYGSFVAGQSLWEQT